MIIVMIVILNYIEMRPPRNDTRPEVTRAPPIQLPREFIIFPLLLPQ